MSNRNLQQTPSGIWLFRRRVPKILSDQYEGVFICMSLETHNIKEARIKRDAINAKINIEMADKKNATSNDKSRFLRFFGGMRDAFVKGVREERNTDEENMFSYAHDPEDLGKENDQAYVAAFKSAMTGETSEQYRLNITELTKEWLVANVGKRPDKYRSSLTTSSNKLLAYLGSEEFPENISPGMAQLFIDKLLEEGRAAKTVNHYKSKLSELWRWGLAREKFQGVNPWDMAKIEATEEQSANEHFRNLSFDEAKVLLDETRLDVLENSRSPYPFAIYCLMRMLPFLGCRLSELARAKREQVVLNGGNFVIEVHKGKTKNAVRVVPVCSHIVPLLKEALKRSEGSEYLFPEITSQNNISSISSRISKLTSTFEKITGFKTSIHSLRGQFATALEETGCPEELAVVLAGHRRLSLTYDLYSKHKHYDTLWPHIEKLQQAEALKAWVD